MNEVLPLALPMLEDLAPFVRDRVARWLCRWAAYVPLEVAAGALAAYPRTKGPNMTQLVKTVIEERGESAVA